jgi:hypothetical protein
MPSEPALQANSKSAQWHVGRRADRLGTTVPDGLTA